MQVKFIPVASVHGTTFEGPHGGFAPENMEPALRRHDPAQAAEAQALTSGTDGSNSPRGYTLMVVSFLAPIR
jgi:hypothetical protein